MVHEVLHIVPRDDLIEHHSRDNVPCPCGPRLKSVTGKDGESLGWVVIHHSLDGRERDERGRLRG